VAGRHVWEHNNLAAEKSDYRELAPDRWSYCGFGQQLEGNCRSPFVLELVRPANRVSLQSRIDS